MSSWFKMVTASGDDLSPVADALEYFEDQLKEAKAELRLKGKRIFEMSSKLPGMTEHRFGQLQEVEAILNYLEKKRERVVHDRRVYYTTGYGKQLTERAIEKYAAAAVEVVVYDEIIGEVSFIRNLYLGLIKSYEALNWQISNMIKLVQAQAEDAIF